MLVFRNSRQTPTGASSLVLTLWVAGLALVMGLVLSSLATSHIQFGSKLETLTRADVACEAVVALALEELAANPEYGLEQEPEASLELEVNGVTARLSFNPEQAESWGVPLSHSNRFNVEAVVAESGELVPPRSVYLVAVSEVGETHRALTVVMHVSGFPYAVASSGPLVSEGTLVVGAVASVDDPNLSLDPDSLQPGDLVSNESVDIKGAATITGRLRSHGKVSLSPQAVVHGDIEEYTDESEIDSFDIASLRPTESLPLTPAASTVIDDTRHFNDPSLSLPGGLTLDQGVLYVNGDLHISGGLKGMGAIICNGDVTIDGGASFAADDQLAIVAQGDVTISGQGADRSVFQGLIYTEGNLYAESTTLLGVFVANGESTALHSGSTVLLKDAGVIHYPEYGNFHLDGSGYLFYQEPNVQTILTGGEEEPEPYPLNGTYTNDSSGEKTLFLFSADEADAITIDEAVGQSSRDGAGAEDGNGNGSAETLSWTIDLEPYIAVVKGRKAKSVDGVIVSEWTELTPEEVRLHMEQMQGFFGESVVLKQYKADPDLKIVREIRTSFDFNLNEFLATESGTRIISWKIE